MRLGVAEGTDAFRRRAGQGSAGSTRGFLMTLEAAFSLTLLIIAAAALPAFLPQKNSAPDFFLCTDAAAALANSGAFSDATGLQLQGQVNSMHALSGMCVEASVPLGRQASSCAKAKEGKEKTQLTVPVFDGNFVQNAGVSCWFES